MVSISKESGGRMWGDDSESSVGKRFKWKPQSLNVYVDVCALSL